MKPAEAAAALEAMALGDAGTKRVMVVLSKNLYKVDKGTTILSSLETPTALQTE